jgi:hypothetical protein
MNIHDTPCILYLQGFFSPHPPLEGMDFVLWHALRASKPTMHTTEKVPLPQNLGEGLGVGVYYSPQLGYLPR